MAKGEVTNCDLTLYGVRTREINQAVKRNTTKFPPNYLVELTFDEWNGLKSQIVTSIKGGKVNK